MIARINGWYSVGIPILFLVMFVNTMIFVNIGNRWKMKRKEVSVEKSRLTTRMIMSKFEILQNGRTSDELKNIWDNIQKSIFLAKKSHLYSMGSWQISRLIIACFTCYICIQFFYRAVSFGVTPALL